MIERASPGMSTEDGYCNGESGPEEQQPAVSTERDSPAESPGGGQQKRGPPAPAPPGAKRSRRSVQKRVVSVPIEGGGEGEGPPPPDSWAWRKYGQKPIKGSPYPRGYYRCSSSKGCSARKQVERSRLDPDMLLVTYSFDHDHPCPQPKNQALADDKPPSPPPAEADELAEPEAPEHKFVEPEVTVEMPETPAREACGGEERFEWFDQMSLESMGLYAPTFEALDVALPLPLPLPEEEWARELQGEDALFAGLGELPECAFVFGRRRDLGLAAAASCS